VGAPGGAHFEFTRINIAPTILPKKIEDLREACAPELIASGTSRDPDTLTGRRGPALVISGRGLRPQDSRNTTAFSRVATADRFLYDAKRWADGGTARPLDKREDHDQPFIMVERLP